MTTTAKTPDQIADAILDPGTGTGRDLPGRYRNEVRELLLEATRIEIAQGEAKHRAALEDLEAYRANVGPLAGIVLVSRYARLGKYTAALLGSHEAWSDGDMLPAIAEAWSLTDSNLISDQTPEQLAHWRKVADALGIEHDGEDEEELETCAEDDCDESLDDGEGYDGYCGTHADQREAAGVYDGEGVPA